MSEIVTAYRRNCALSAKKHHDKAEEWITIAEQRLPGDPASALAMAHATMARYYQHEIGWNQTTVWAMLEDDEL